LGAERPQRDTNRAGEWFFVPGWHLQDFHFFSLGGSLSPQFQQYLASGGLMDWQFLLVHRTESEPSVP
jgi:hypothetical protein